MFKDTDLVNIYTDYDYKIYMPSANKSDGDYILSPKINNEPYYIPVLWRDVVNVNRISRQIKARVIRFEANIEDEAYKQLRIDFTREKDTFTREQVENMILNPNDEVLGQIVAIRDIKVIETFLSQLVALKNTNQFFIAEKVELYIRARKEELEQGLNHSELEITPTENIDLAVVENIEDEIEKVEEEKVEVKVIPKVTPKKTTTPRKTTIAKKPTTVKGK